MSTKKGFYAKKDYKAGDEILKFDDSHVFTDRTQLDYYKERGFLDFFPKGRIVELQAPEKYIRHSDNPNTVIKMIKGTRVLIAKVDIKTGEEITRDERTHLSN